MKNTSGIVIVCLTMLSLGLLAYIAPAQSPTPVKTPFTISDEELAKLTDADIAKTEAHKNELEGVVIQKLDKSIEVAKNQGSSLSDIKTAGEETTKAFGEYKQWAGEEIARGNKAIFALSGVLKKLHRAKFIATGIWIALCAFVAFRLQKVPILGQYAFYGVAAVAIAGTTFIWIWL